MKAIKTSNAVNHSGKHFNAGEILLVGKGKDINDKDAEYLIEIGAAEETVEPTEDKQKDELAIDEMATLADLSQLTIKDLKSVCAYFRLEDYSNLNKAALITLIEDHRDGGGDIDLDTLNEDELRTLAAKEGIDISGVVDIEAIRDLIDAELGE